MLIVAAFSSMVIGQPLKSRTRSRPFWSIVAVLTSFRTLEDVPARRDVDCEENVPDGCKMCLGDVDCVEDVPEVWDDVLVYGTRDVD